MLLFRDRAARCCLKLLFPALLAAVCLGGGNTSAWAREPIIPLEQDAAPGDIPKNPFHRSGDPCPDNITVKTWTQSSTAWREAYEACKPKGAPAKYKYTQKDVEKYFRWDCPDYPKFGGHDIVFEKWTPKVRLLGIVFKKGSPNFLQAARAAERAVEALKQFFETNGHDIKKEKLIIMAHAYVKGGNTENVYAMYDFQKDKIGSGVKNDHWAWSLIKD